MELPKEKIVQFSGDTGVFFSLDEFQTILAIYSSYISLADENIMLDEDLYYLNLQYDSCLNEVETSDKMVQVLAKDSKRMINIIYEQSKRAEEKTNKELLFRTLIGTGGLVVGVAVGLLIGMAAP